MSKKIFVWGNYDGNDRVLTIKECLKEQGYIVTEDRSGNKYKNFYLSDAVYIPPMSVAVLFLPSSRPAPTYQS